MAAKRTNPHKNFMVFNAVLFFAVLFITALFLYLAYTFKRDADKAVISYKGRYHIEVSTDFAGESLSIYVNDSLLMDGTMPDTLVSLDINRFAEVERGNGICLLVYNQQGVLFGKAVDV